MKKLSFAGSALVALMAGELCAGATTESGDAPCAREPKSATNLREIRAPFELSTDYRMTVDGKPIDVFRVPTPENRLEPDQRHPYSYAPFVATGTVEVCVKSGCFDLSKARVLPASKGVAGAWIEERGELRFGITPPMTVVLEPKGRHRALVVSANVPEPDPPDRKDPKVRYFAPGYHRADKIVLNDGETLYLAPGSWVEGWLQAEGRNLTVCGSGVLSGACWEWRKGPRDEKGLNLSGRLATLSGRDIAVRDVTFFSSWGWTLVLNAVTNALVDNVKVICGRVINDDGIDVCRAKDVVLRNSFVRCQDDCVTPKWWCENLVCTNMTLWTDAANAFRTGYECESGESGLVYRNLLFRDIDVLHLSIPKTRASDYWANCAIYIQPSRGQTMYDTVYDDIRFHECGPEDIFLNVKTMPVTQGYQFPEAGMLKGLTLRNIRLPDSRGGMCVNISSHDVLHRVEGVRFENVTGYGPFSRTIGSVRKPNYDRSKIAPYALEDPLRFADGRKVASPAEWPARRREILGIFAREMFGAEPPKPEALVTEKTEEGVTLGGFAIRRQYRMWFRADRTGPAIDWLVLLPKQAKERSPVILFLNYAGNHELIPDREVSVPDCWLRTSARQNHRPDPAKRGVATDPNRKDFVFPVGEILARGYAVMSACYAQVSPDPDGWSVETPEHCQDSFAYTGVFGLWPKRNLDRTDNVTAIGAWAWALSRGLDLAGRIPEIDAKRSVATGYSRLGKTALLAAARDERFAVCVPNQTGGGGCPLAKRDYGENVSTETHSFTHWYCTAYAKYAEDPAKLLTFDQHLLLASVAPRALLVEGYDEPWFDTEGEYLACRAAAPVWTFLGKGTMPDLPYPPDYDTSCIGPSLGYVRRDLWHGHAHCDWKWLLDFADKALRQPPF